MTSGGEGSGFVLGRVEIPLFTGQFTAVLTESVRPSSGIINVDMDFRSPTATCWHEPTAFSFTTSNALNQGRTGSYPSGPPAFTCQTWTEAVAYIGPFSSRAQAATWTYEVTVEPISTSICPYGTRTIAGQAPIQFLDNALLTAILAPFAALELVAFYVGFLGTQYLIEDLCSRPPPSVPIYTGADLIRSVQFLKQLLDAAAWPHFCECVPGTPTPQPPPLPVIVIPPDLATRPVPVCSEVDLCASIIRLLDQVGQLQTVVGQLWTLATISQRYGTPFASIRGRSIGGLTGSGTAAIDRLIALQAVVNTKPAGLQEFTGAPTYIADLGWISALTDDGMIDEIRLTRDVQVWASKLLPYATRVGWGLREGVTVTLTELLAEP
jgi:hypothetical protein